MKESVALLKTAKEKVVMEMHEKEASYLKKLKDKQRELENTKRREEYAKRLKGNQIRKLKEKLDNVAQKAHDWEEPFHL